VGVTVEVAVVVEVGVLVHKQGTERVTGIDVAFAPEFQLAVFRINEDRQLKFG
jgi:hypothetical protein